MERTRSLVPQVSGSLPLQALSTKVNIRSEAPRPAERRVRDGWSARGFRESEVLHLALLDEVFHGSGDVFDRHVGIYAVLIEQVDDIGLEALERCPAMATGETTAVLLDACCRLVDLVDTPLH